MEGLRLIQTLTPEGYGGEDENSLLWANHDADQVDAAIAQILDVQALQQLNSTENPFQEYIEEQVKGERRSGSLLGRGRHIKALIPPIQAAKQAMSTKNSWQIRQVQLDKLAKLRHVRNQMAAYSQSNVQGGLGGQIEELRSWGLVHASQQSTNKGSDDLNLGSASPIDGPVRLQGPYMKANLSKFIGGRAHHKEEQALDDRTSGDKTSPRRWRAFRERKSVKVERIPPDLLQTSAAMQMQAQLQMAAREIDSRDRANIIALADAAKALQGMRPSDDRQWQKRNEEKRANTKSADRNAKQVLVQSRQLNRKGNETTNVSNQVNQRSTEKSNDRSTSKTKQFYHSSLPTPSTYNNTASTAHQRTSQPFRKLGKNKPDAPFTPVVPKLNLKPNVQPFMNERSWIQARKQSGGTASDHRLPSPDSTHASMQPKFRNKMQTDSNGSSRMSNFGNKLKSLATSRETKKKGQKIVITNKNHAELNQEETLEGQIVTSKKVIEQLSPSFKEDSQGGQKSSYFEQRSSQSQKKHSSKDKNFFKSNLALQEKPSLRKWDGSTERFGLSYLQHPSATDRMAGGASGGISGGVKTADAKACQTMASTSQQVFQQDLLNPLVINGKVQMPINSTNANEGGDETQNQLVLLSPHRSPHTLMSKESKKSKELAEQDAVKQGKESGAGLKGAEAVTDPYILITNLKDYREASNAGKDSGANSVQGVGQMAPAAGIHDYSEQRDKITDPKMKEFEELRSKESQGNPEELDQGASDDVPCSPSHLLQLQEQNSETLTNAANRGPVPIKEMRLVSLDKGSQLFKQERKSLPTSTKGRKNSRQAPQRPFKAGDIAESIDQRQMWEVVSPTLVPMLPPPKLPAIRPEPGEKKNLNLPSVKSPKTTIIRESPQEQNEMILFAGVRSPGVDSLLQHSHDPKRESREKAQGYDSCIQRQRNAEPRAQHLPKQIRVANMSTTSGQKSPGAFVGLDTQNENQRKTIIQNAEQLKMDLQIDLDLLRERQQYQDQQAQAAGHINPSDLEELGNKIFELDPNYQPDFAKKLRPVYIFRDELDVFKTAEKKQNDIVLRKFGLRSLSHVADQQRSINQRIHSLVEPNKVSGAPNFPKKLESFQNELYSSFYSEVSDMITTMRTTGHNLGRRGGVALDRQNQTGAGSPRQQNFLASISYGQPKQSVVVDNRSTCLFRDYFKVIGSRYKFQLEDLLSKQASAKKTTMRNKFASFQKRLSAHYMNERNCSNPNKDLFDKYIKNDGFQEQRRDRSPRMTLGEMGLDHLAMKDPKEERKLKTLVVAGLPATPTPAEDGDDRPPRLVLYSTLNGMNMPAAPNGQNISNQTLAQIAEHGERDITFDHSDPALNVLGSQASGIAGDRNNASLFTSFPNNQTGAGPGVAGQNVQTQKKKKKDEAENVQSILKNQNPFSSRNQSSKSGEVVVAKSTDGNSRSNQRSKDENLPDDLHSTFRKSDDQNEQQKKSLRQIHALRVEKTNKNAVKRQSNADLQSYEAGKDRNSLLTKHESKATNKGFIMKTETTVHSQVDNQTSLSLFKQMQYRQDAPQGDNRSQRTLSRGGRSGQKDHVFIRKGDQLFPGQAGVLVGEAVSGKPRQNTQMMNQLSPKVVMHKPKFGSCGPPTEELNQDVLDKIENEDIVDCIPNGYQRDGHHLDPKAASRQILVQNQLYNQITRKYENLLIRREANQQSPRSINQLVKQPKVLKIKNAGKVEIVGHSIRINSRSSQADPHHFAGGQSPREGTIQVPPSHVPLSIRNIGYASPNQINLSNTIISAQIQNANDPTDIPAIPEMPIDSDELHQIYVERSPKDSPINKHQGLKNRVVANALSSAEKLTLLQRVASPIDKIIIQQNSQSLEVLRKHNSVAQDAGQANIIINDNMCNSKKQSEFEISEATDESNLLVNTLNLTARQEFAGDGDELPGLDAKAKRKYPSGHFKPLSNKATKPILGGGFGQSSKNLQKLMKEQQSQQSQSHYSTVHAKISKGEKTSSKSGGSLGPLVKGNSSKKAQQFLPAPQKGQKVLRSQEDDR